MTDIWGKGRNWVPIVLMLFAGFACSSPPADPESDQSVDEGTHSEPRAPAAADFESDSAPLVPLAREEPGERREEVLDALRVTRTFDLVEDRGREIVPVSAWLTPGEISRYEAGADTLEFRVRGRAASADPEGNLVFREEGRFNVEIIVRGPDESEKFRQVMTGFRNHFDGVRQARVTYRVPRDGGWEEVAQFTVPYEGTVGSATIPRAAWFDPDRLDSEGERDWLRAEDFGLLNMRSLDSRHGEVDREGTLRYRQDGDVRLTFRKPGGTLFDTVAVDITNVTDGIRWVSRVRHEPKPMAVSEHVLVIYNQSSADSEALKDYYVRERPGFEEVNVLGVRTSSEELITEAEYRNEVRDPVVEWLLEAGKPIRYIVLMLDIPTRVHARVPHEGSYRLQIGDSLSHRLAFALRDEGIRDGDTYFDASHQGSPTTWLGTPFSVAQFEGMTALVTHLNMGSLEASIAYVDKLKSFDRTGAVLHPADDTYARTFYMEDHDAHSRLPSNFFGHRYLERMSTGFLRLEEMDIEYRPKGSAYIEAGENVAFFGTMGRWGNRGANYAVDGRIQWGENSDWWLMLSVESFNGQRDPARRQGGEAHAFYGPMDQGNFIDWFHADAFGGSNYSRTPVGAVCHVEEPTTGGVNDWSYLAMWQDGFTFAECAWVSRNTGRFMAIGDPLVTRKPPEPGSHLLPE